MIIAGIRPLTLLDYPNHIAATIFVGGCNFRCPFCHNRELVLTPQAEFTTTNTLKLLKERAGKLEGVCITGGEPTLYGDSLAAFIREIRRLGLKVKLDTNGTNPTLLRSLIEARQLDYVAMDIKSSKPRYSKAVGVEDCKLEEIEESALLLMQNLIPHEFRTTMVKELISYNDARLIGRWLQGASYYYLQEFVNSKHNIKQGFTGYTKDEMEELATALRKYIKNVELRGV